MCYGLLLLITRISLEVLVDMGVLVFLNCTLGFRLLKESHSIWPYLQHSVNTCPS